jgi:hypothetical protein
VRAAPGGRLSGLPLPDKARVSLEADVQEPLRDWLAAERPGGQRRHLLGERDLRPGSQLHVGSGGRPVRLLPRRHGLGEAAHQ